MNQRAFTFIETVIAITIFSVIMVAVASYVILAYKNNYYVWNYTIAVDDARRSIDAMAEEIRNARPGDNGSYPIEKAGDKELIFYSDIDKDGVTEKVHYFLSTVNSGSLVKECVTYQVGGYCTVNFSNFLEGTLISAQLKVYLEGDLGQSDEYVTVKVDGQTFSSTFCKTGCTDCAGKWEGGVAYDVTSLASDGSLSVTADGNNKVHSQCQWVNPNHSLKVRIELSWSEEVVGEGSQLNKGVIKPTTPPVTYPDNQEKESIVTSFVENDPPIFIYYDKSGNEILNLPARPVDTRLIKIFLVIDTDPERSPRPVEFETYVYPRNLNFIE